MPSRNRERDWSCTTCEAGTRAFCRDPQIRSFISEIRSGTQTFGKGETAIRQGAACLDVLVVLEGWLALSEILSDGRKQILSFAMPGDVIGCVTLGIEAPFLAETLTPVRLCVLPRAKLTELAESQPSLAFSMINVTEVTKMNAFSHLATVGRRNARERVAALLLELFLRNGGDLRHASRMIVPLTQALMADALGLTLVHTNRMLRGLSRDGIIAFSREQLWVIQPMHLLHAAGFDSLLDPQIGLWQRSGRNLFEHVRQLKQIPAEIALGADSEPRPIARTNLAEKPSLVPDSRV